MRDELWDKMIQVINNMEMFTEKKKKTKRMGRLRNKGKNLKKERS